MKPKTKTTSQATIGGLLGLVLAASASAAPLWNTGSGRGVTPVNDAVARSLSGIAIEGGSISQHYTEWSRGYGNPNLPNPLDQESGTIGMLRFTASLYSPQFYGLWGEVRYDFAPGTTTYDGHYQNLSPLHSFTDNTLTGLRARIGYPIGLAYGVTAVPFAEGGYYRWDRSVGTGKSFGLSELYSNGYVGGGMKFLISPARKLVLSAAVDGGSTIYGGMSLRSPYKANLDLGNHAYVGIGVQADYRLCDHWHAIARVAYRYFGYGKSNSVPVGNGSASEPNSTTSQVRAALGVSYDF